jgi:hypothetical protein
MRFDIVAPGLPALTVISGFPADVATEVGATVGVGAFVGACVGAALAGSGDGVNGAADGEPTTVVGVAVGVNGVAEGDIDNVGDGEAPGCKVAEDVPEGSGGLLDPPEQPHANAMNATIKMDMPRVTFIVVVSSPASAALSSQPFGIDSFRSAA